MVDMWSLATSVCSYIHCYQCPPCWSQNVFSADYNLLAYEEGKFSLDLQSLRGKIGWRPTILVRRLMTIKKVDWVYILWISDDEYGTLWPMIRLYQKGITFPKMCIKIDVLCLHCLWQEDHPFSPSTVEIATARYNLCGTGRFQCIPSDTETLLALSTYAIGKHSSGDWCCSTYIGSPGARKFGFKVTLRFENWLWCSHCTGDVTRKINELSSATRQEMS